ncbi:hypothetical protein AVEN_173527-1 [Araneus ventricosus]|uniref:Uncharacterized protein n=1 Tax=Araneus ventricosus TaxID=182803 RepID=A0A4Y2MY63_ARAVE|nr:hypothetical protein AVEN_173527-1 [Araneus ventricosus]
MGIDDTNFWYMIGDRLYQMSKQRSRKFEIFGYGGVRALSCRSMTSQMCCIGLRDGKLSGQDIKWNSSVCSPNHSNSDPCDMRRCPAGKFHFQLRIQTPCKVATEK